MAWNTLSGWRGRGKRYYYTLSPPLGREAAWRGKGAIGLGLNGSRLLPLYTAILLLLGIAPAALPAWASSGEGPGTGFRAKPAVLLAYLPDPGLWEELNSIPLRWAPGHRGYGYALGERVEWVPGSSGEPVLVLQGGGSSGGSEPEAVVVYGSPGLEGFASRLARIHSELGVRTRIVSMDYVVENYEPATPPPYTVGGEEVERYASSGYNLSRALALVSFLRSLVEGNTSVRYVVLLGDAAQIPPLYYRSPVLTALLSPVDGLVPTDYWYMDPDYDWDVELAVGRIPLTDMVSLSKYLDALEEWVRGGDWQGAGLVAGGALFAWPLMMGETFASDASLVLSSKLSLSYLLLSTGNYSSLDFTASLGRYGYYFVASHGVGNAYVDYRPGGVWGYRFEELLRADSIPFTLRPAAYASPACLTAWWDDALLEPGFAPPSIGVALLSRGAGVAYVGPARVAIEFLVEVSAEGNGDYSVGYYGAMRLVQLYASMLQGSETLGEAYAKALEAYISLPYTSLEALTPAGAEKLGYLTVFEFTFLGDPVAPNKAYTLPDRERKPVNMEAPGYTPLPLKAVLTRFAAEAQGEMPLLVVEPGDNVTVVFNRCPSAAKAVAVYRYAGLLVDIRSIDVELVGGNGTCRGVFQAPEEPPGFYIVEYWYNTSLERRLLGVAGYKAVAHANGTVELEIWGLDLLRVLGDEPVYILVDGRPEYIVPGGRFSAELSLHLGPGRHTLAVLPWRDYSIPAGGLEVAAAKKKLVEVYTGVVAVPEAREKEQLPLALRTGVAGSKAYILALLEGEPVEANITAWTPAGDTVPVESLGKGLYTVELPSGEPVIVEARYENGTVEARGGGIIAATAAPPSPTGAGGGAPPTNSSTNTPQPQGPWQATGEGEANCSPLQAWQVGVLAAVTAAAASLASILACPRTRCSGGGG